MTGFRYRLAGWHLLASLATVVLAGGFFYFGWYAWPGWYLLGAHLVLGILVLVDVGLGPLATFVVSNPAKPRKELRRDIAFIVFVQCVALGYGLHTLWTGRPLYYAFSGDRIQIVPAAVYDERKLEKARESGATIMPDWTSLPRWIWVPLPDDPDESMRIIAASLLGGPDIIALPQYFRPYEKALPVLREQLLSLRTLLDSSAMSESDYRKLLARLGRPEAELGVLPVEGRFKDGSWIIDRKTGAPLLFQPVVVWDAVAQKKKLHKGE